MRFPVNGTKDVNYRLTNRFDPVNHPGLDIAPLPAGTRGVGCFSPEGAYVYRSAFKSSPEGHYVILRGNSGVYYYFGHFESRSVQAGQNINEGAEIGKLGMTGRATGIHTHHEVRPNGPGPGSAIDPLKYYNQIKGVTVLDNNDIKWMYLAAGHSDAESSKKANLDFWRGKKPESLARELYTGNEAFRYKGSHYDADVAAAQNSQFEKLNFEVFKKK